MEVDLAGRIGSVRWGLEEPNKRPASRHGWGIKICGSPPIRKYIYQ